MHNTLGNKYKIIDEIISNSEYSAYICNNVINSDDKDKYIVNIYHSKEYVKTILPHSVNLSTDACSEFVEVFTNNSELALVFKYTPGTEFNTRQLKAFRKSIYDRLLLAYNYLEATLNISDLPDIIKISMISNKTLFFSSDNKVFYNYIIDISGLSQKMQFDITILKICTITLKAIFSDSISIPESIESIILKASNNEYASVNELFSDYERIYEKTLFQLEEDEKKSLTISVKNNGANNKYSKYNKKEQNGLNKLSIAKSQTLREAIRQSRPTLQIAYKKITVNAKKLINIGQKEFNNRLKKTKVNSLLFRLIKYILATTITLGIIVSVSYLFYSSLKKAALDSVALNNNEDSYKEKLSQQNTQTLDETKNDTTLSSDAHDSDSQNAGNQGASDAQATEAKNSTESTSTKDLNKSEYEIYVVKSGDTLYSISLDYFNDGMSNTIKEYNQLNTDSLHIGQELKIPKLTSTESVEATRETKENSEYCLHTVRENDTLSSISKIYYGSSAYYNKIAEYNQLTENEVLNLQLGKVLKIPNLTE